MTCYIKKILTGFFGGILLFIPFLHFDAQFEIIQYSNASYFNLPLWIFFFYGTLSVLMVYFFPKLENYLTATFYFKRYLIFIEYLAIAFAFLIPIFFRSNSLLIFSFLGIYTLLRLGFFHAKWDWLFFVLGALLGPTFELFLSNFDLVRYPDPDFWGIPYWLPVQWGILAMSGRRFADVLDYLFKKKTG